MSCGCTPPVRTSLWTPIPTFKTALIPGENLDCYVKRADDSGPKDDARVDLVNRIQNTSIPVDGQLKVNVQFTLSAGPRTATSWTYSPSIPGLSMSSGGKLSGTIDTSQENQTLKTTVTASDGSGTIDSREYTVCPANPAKGDSIQIIHPYIPASGSSKISSPFGPRIHPVTGINKPHNGQDWVAVDAGAKGKGTVVAAADGEVIAAGFDQSGGGNYIKINHKGSSGSVLFMSMYCHLSQALVTTGQKVSAGQTIGKEGSTGASTGPHLHFEVRLGGTLPVDPTPYYTTAITVTPPAQPVTDSSGNPVTDSSGTIVTTQPADQTKQPSGASITSNEVAGRTADSCPKVLTDPTIKTPEPVFIKPATTNKTPASSSCAPATPPSAAEVQAAIDKALNEDSTLTAEDKKIIKFIAKIESNNNPSAVPPNNVSSATGLYQMLDKTADAYFNKAGLAASCENRNDAYASTKAMIPFYKDMKAYWTGFLSSGKTTIAGKKIIDTPHSERYAGLSLGEFCYGLIHHDGVGNAVNGVDCGGVVYWQQKVRQLGFS